MARATKPTPLQAFELNMDDARQLALLAEALTNQRSRRLRAEMREKLGQALRVPQSKRSQLDCIKSGDAYVILTPGSRLSRTQLEDLRPLLRQAIVAGAAATETYMADVALKHVGSVISSDSKATEKVRRVPMSVGDWLYIEQHYERRRRGLKSRVLEPYIREFASTSPSKVGESPFIAWHEELDEDNRHRASLPGTRHGAISNGSRSVETRLHMRGIGADTGAPTSLSTRSCMTSTLWSRSFARSMQRSLITSPNQIGSLPIQPRRTPPYPRSPHLQVAAAPAP